MSWEDSVGNLLIEGDIVRMRHFRTITKKYYMYKRFLGYKKIDNTDKIYAEYEHLEGDGGVFRDYDNKYGKDVVVVQRRKFHNNRKIDELKRNPKMRD